VPKFYVDSNVFFYAKIMDKKYGESCSGIIRSIAARELDAAISSLVIIEVANALRKYGRSREVAPEVRAIASLGMETYTVDASDVQEAAEIFDLVGISPYDCLHAAIIRRYKLSQIISADKEFDKIDWLNRIDPQRLPS
jgi:uncharacterized protein